MRKVAVGTPQPSVGVKKAERLSRLIRDDIMLGRLQPGAPLPTQGELGQRYGIGASTASVALARLAQEGLVVRIPGQGSFVARNRGVNVATRSIEFVRPGGGLGRERRTTELAIIEDWTRYTQSRGWKAHWHHMNEAETLDLEQLVEQFDDAAGVIAMIRLTLGPDFVRRLYERGVPAVAVAMRETPHDPAPFPMVGWDRVQMGRAAAEHVIQRGYRRIAFVYHRWPQSTQQIARFHVGFLDAVQEHQLPIPAQWLIGVNDAEDCRQKVAALLAGNDRPEALCLDNGRHAAGAEEIALAMGLNVPRDLALMCCNGGIFAEEAPVPISDVMYDFTDIVAKAVELIEQLEPGFKPDMSDLKPPVMIPARLRVRESC